MRSSPVPATQAEPPQEEAQPDAPDPRSGESSQFQQTNIFTAVSKSIYSSLPREVLRWAIYLEVDGHCSSSSQVFDLGFRRTVVHHIRQLPSFWPMRIRLYPHCSVVDEHLPIYYRQYTRVGMV